MKWLSLFKKKPKNQWVVVAFKMYANAPIIKNPVYGPFDTGLEASAFINGKVLVDDWVYCIRGFTK